MSYNRRALIAGLAATLLAPRRARAASVTDGGGRAVPVPARVERVFPAGPPAAIFLYTLAPELLIGWPRANRPEEREFLLPDVGGRPEVGRITGRGNTANLEVVLALKPDLILDVGSVNPTYVSLADRVQQQTGIPYALLDGRFEGIPLSYRTLGALIGWREQGESLASNAEDTMKTITQRVGSIPPDRRPRVYYAPRAARARDRARRLDQRGDDRVRRAERRRRHAQRARQRLDRAGAVVGSRCDHHHRPGFRGECFERSGLGTGCRRARAPGASLPEAAVRLGRFSPGGEPVDRPVVACENPVPGFVPRGFARADAGVLCALLPRDAERGANRPGVGGPGLTRPY